MGAQHRQDDAGGELVRRADRSTASRAPWPHALHRRRRSADDQQHRRPTFTGSDAPRLPLRDRRIRRGMVAAAPGRARRRRSPSPLRALPRMVRPAFVPGPARPLGTTRTSRIRVRAAPAIARAAPAEAATAVAGVATKTPEDSTTSSRSSLAGETRPARLWVKVGLAILPNGRTGWLPRAALGGYGSVDTQLVVDLRRLTAALTKAGRVVFLAPVGVGQPTCRLRAAISTFATA